MTTRNVARVVAGAACVLLGLWNTGSAFAEDSTSWSGSLFAGYAELMEDNAPDGSFGVRANALANVHPVFGVGLEAGWAKLGDISGADLSTYYGAGVFRVRATQGSLRPYGIVGAGLYGEKVSSSTDTFFGFNIGTGVTYPGNAPTSFGIEVRWHDIVTDTADDNLLTVMAGINLH